MKCAFALLLASAVFPGLLTQTQAQPAPLIHGHAHNDYEHQRPLFDALDRGFCSVEADIYLVEGQFLVAHDRWQCKPERTLQALYLDPLRELVRKNGGHVYPNGPDFTLLIEFKGDWQTSYPVLRDVLKQYASMLTVFRDDKKETNAITVIITGHRSREMFAGESVRYAALDGDLPDLETRDSANLIPWISSNWSQSFKWRGNGPIPDAEKAKLKEIVTKAHEQGRKVRFWGAPDKPAFWTELLADEVDLINTDDLPGLQQLFAAREHK
ncbi:MAG TPA: phosphatidylinositol-specific phospholipase C/glycerophosphodiester phosphodiesterase family protein [Candidatus Binatia bacterium]|jgi:hypothetical protein|nr:phosphatidylinositol-specific phospholipase C/glycerophosphodiester phosphodiesterase family protein [Candidatus Binatia bacterium]